ncbi:hypothetical protein ABTY98_00040 [Streptomyces sp. NPDC096040]|uniref:hypothetical protein n=1 Tax=Streptomyces sp. NPDC096040 TaxID=3155541 RepID=UPI00332535C2
MQRPAYSDYSVKRDESITKGEEKVKFANVDRLIRAIRVAGGVRLRRTRSRVAPRDHADPVPQRARPHMRRPRTGSARKKRDVEQGIASGRFSVADPVIALTALNGSLLALLELWSNKPEVDSDRAAGAMAEMLLHMLGLSPDEARDVARRSLPPAA